MISSEFVFDGPHAVLKTSPSSTTTNNGIRDPMHRNRMRPIHPDEILREEYLRPLDMSANRLAQSLGVPANRISGIVSGARAVTADTALRLAKFFGTSPELWLNLQQA